MTYSSLNISTLRKIIVEFRMVDLTNFTWNGAFFKLVTGYTLRKLEHSPKYFSLMILYHNKTNYTVEKAISEAW